MTVNGITSVWRGGLEVGRSIYILTRLRTQEIDFLWEKKSLVSISGNGVYIYLFAHCFCRGVCWSFCFGNMIRTKLDHFWNIIFWKITETFFFKRRPFSFPRSQLMKICTLSKSIGKVYQKQSTIVVEWLLLLFGGIKKKLIAHRYIFPCFHVPYIKLFSLKCGCKVFNAPFVVDN